MRVCKGCGVEFDRNRKFCGTACRVSYWNNAGRPDEKTWVKRNPEKVMLRSAKHRAKKRGYSFDLTLEDIVIPELCPVFGVPLVSNAGTGHARQDSPSLDKIIPDLGYTKDNVQVISNLANVMKHDASPEQLILFAEWVLKTYKGDTHEPQAHSNC